MLIQSVHLKNFLSYGSDSEPLELRPLNLIIGPNGSGKSNLIEAVDLLRATPKDLLRPIRDGGGIRDWLWKGEKGIAVATINAVLSSPNSTQSNLRYVLSFTEVMQHFEITDERVENEKPDSGHMQPYFYYKFENGHGVLNVKTKMRQLKHEEIDVSASILSQRKDPDQYPELTYLGSVFDKIRLYREWSFGRYTPPRMPQKADMPNDYLEPDCRNLGLVLNRLASTPSAKKRVVSALQALYEGIDDYHVQIEGGTVQVFLHEGDRSIPATRLSDGTLRYLCLLAILCHPAPPPLICIEEPELGLHPDVLPALADLLKEAAERTQLIVTTHSDVLVDAMSDQPESVIVAEKDETGTQLRRLSKAELAPWLEKYRLGQLWTRGDLGGTRW
ncbi:chromosome segregation protein SMC [Pokkaliibacter plantistimulans]|uniref:Chromosome segregation protein SMC n=1 Tax=Pokkaliibacter plantistimulans TaxID=1635171 RepID=A0ABX5LXU1_9GAMM|nr:AAA family ATPase [Pokkaliibacter plantistimulans]PXF31434.1 chromosome segregation protein SMC [Pokkaliibacter plantistimulans]